MALTIKQLIEKLERVEDKTGDVFIEFPGEFLSVDTVLLDNEGDITLLMKWLHIIVIVKSVKQVKQNFNSLVIDKRKQTRYN